MSDKKPKRKPPILVDEAEIGETDDAWLDDDDLLEPDLPVAGPEEDDEDDPTADLDDDMDDLLESEAPEPWPEETMDEDQAGFEDPADWDDLLEEPEVEMLPLPDVAEEAPSEPPRSFPPLPPKDDDSDEEEDDDDGPLGTLPPGPLRRPELEPMVVSWRFLARLGGVQVPAICSTGQGDSELHVAYELQESSRVALPLGEEVLIVPLSGPEPRVILGLLVDGRQITAEFSLQRTEGPPQLILGRQLLASGRLVVDVTRGPA